jgi:hypothetical protein
MQHRDEGGEVTPVGRGEERVHGLPLASQVGVGRHLGWTPASGLMTGSGRWTASGSSCRRLRERSMFRHTRATTVVSQPPRFSTSAAPARLSRTQASCTASSASASEPSIR